MNRFLQLCWLIGMLIVGIPALYGQTDSEKVTIKMRQVSVQAVLQEIEKQTDITFSYESSLLNDLPLVNFRVKKKSVSDCLQRLFANYPISYQQVGTIIIIKKYIREESGFLPKENRTTSDTERTASLQEVVVTGQNPDMCTLQSPHTGTLAVDQQTVQHIPTLMGEEDIIKTLHLTPGVSTGTEGTAGLFVRGGNGDGNLFLIDGHPIYQMNHIIGIFSAFNPDAISDMGFYKSGFPARYGGRLSSVVDLQMKEGDMKAYHGSASVGLLSGSLNLEGPILKDRTSFNISLRRTWADLLWMPIMAVANRINKKDGHQDNIRYAFHDLNLKLTHRFSDRSQLDATLFTGNDVFKYGRSEFSEVEDENFYNRDNDYSLRWGNLLATVGWKYAFSNRLSGKMSAVFTRYNSRIKSEILDVKGTEDLPTYRESYSENALQTGIMDVGMRMAFDYLPATNHHLRFGGEYMLHRFRPEYERFVGWNKDVTGEDFVNREKGEEVLWGHEGSLYVEDDWTINNHFRVNGGLRFSLFNVEQKTYTAIEPRLSARWLLRDDLSFKTSYARMNQYVHMVSNNYISLPTDAWLPVTAKLKPMTSDQVAAGFYYDWEQTYSFSMEGYYKQMNNLLEYRDGGTFIPSLNQWEDKLTVGEGRAYGMELMARKQAGRTTGWIGYGLSWSDRLFAELNQGERFPSRYDNRHKVNIAVIHKLSPKVELSAAWTYSSGNHQTVSLENYYEHSFILPNVPDYSILYDNRNNKIDYYEQRNNYQLPAYHRLDLGIKIYRPKKSGRLGIWSVSVYNVYSRLNPFVLIKDTNWESSKVPGKGVDAIPVYKTVGIMPIIPSISYTYKF